MKTYITSELITPVGRVDLEPAEALPGKMLYHVWERTNETLKALWAQPLPVREYRGMVTAEALAPILFPEGE
jgi:hypothetical protein